MSWRASKSLVLYIAELAEAGAGCSELHPAGPCIAPKAAQLTCRGHFLRCLSCLKVKEFLFIPSLKLSSFHFSLFLAFPRHVGLVLTSLHVPSSLGTLLLENGIRLHYNQIKSFRVEHLAFFCLLFSLWHKIATVFDENCCKYILIPKEGILTLKMSLVLSS